jgi:hypothetical protein
MMIINNEVEWIWKEVVVVYTGICLAVRGKKPVNISL